MHLSEPLGGGEGSGGSDGSAKEQESPSLFTAGDDGPAAYEIKFLLTEDQARAVEAYAAAHLAPDPHADPAFGGYRTTSVYTDTPQFEVFNRVGGYARSKLRVRRYGSAGPVFLEQKDKKGDRVRKFRVSVAAEDVPTLAGPASDVDWVGAWFLARLTERRLAPVCRIAYDRRAFLGFADGGGVRVTLDRNIRGEPTNDWELRPVSAITELLPGLVICEFKFRLALPGLFKDAIAALGLVPSPVSKYRRFVAATGLAGEGAADA